MTATDDLPRPDCASCANGWYCIVHDEEPVHAWFDLTYANYLVLPRTLMQSMPQEWQSRIVACLRELQEASAEVPQADRHYPRRSIGCGQLGGPGNVLVLRSLDGLAGWISFYTKHPDDGLHAWRCTMFRNEGPALSSQLIIEAQEVTAQVWGEPPPDGWLTYVDRAKVASTNPGYCYLAAGWWRDRSYTPDRRRASLIRLRSSSAGAVS